MAKIMSYEDNYFDICEETGYSTVIYGAGMYGERIFPYLKNVSYVCDRSADKIKEFHGIPVLSLEKLGEVDEKLLVVICIKSPAVREQVKSVLSDSLKNSMVFDYFDNIGFGIYREKQLEIHKGHKALQHVHVVYDGDGWIIGKFAARMKEELEKRGYRCTVGGAVDPSADINHHVIYDSCSLVVPYRETFMITHVDSYNKLELLKHNLQKALLGICMSRETMEKLAAYGVPREKLCYINPAQDGVIKPKKYVLGITHKTHDDHRKNENVLVDLCRFLNPDYFAFKIMGAGWDRIVETLVDMGFQVDYYSEFIYEEYLKLMPSLDYYLFWGFDEGSMGYLDALRAGVETIVTPQGYHLDVKDGITYPCRTIPEFREALLHLQHKREKIVQSVDTWTWGNFVEKHLEVWNYLLGNEDTIYKNQHMYEDGIFSVLRMKA